jgi:hypothetical protein
MYPGPSSGLVPHGPQAVCPQAVYSCIQSHVAYTAAVAYTALGLYALRLLYSCIQHRIHAYTALRLYTALQSHCPQAAIQLYAAVAYTALRLYALRLYRMYALRLYTAVCSPTALSRIHGPRAVYSCIQHRIHAYTALRMYTAVCSSRIHGPQVVCPQAAIQLYTALQSHTRPSRCIQHCCPR